jgi:tRNA (Thr-GGU) A37 N-methylase
MATTPRESQRVPQLSFRDAPPMILERTGHMAAPHPTRPRFEVAAIGEVRTDTPDAEIGRRRRTLESAVRVYDEFVDGLDGLETYSHLIVLFWMAQAPPCETLRARSHRDPEGPLRGILALRGRQRPNPIGLAVVDLIAREGAVWTLTTGPRSSISNRTTITTCSPICACRHGRTVRRAATGTTAGNADAAEARAPHSPRWPPLVCAVGGPVHPGRGRRERATSRCRTQLRQLDR